MGRISTIYTTRIIIQVRNRHYDEATGGSLNGQENSIQCIRTENIVLQRATNDQSDVLQELLKVLFYVHGASHGITQDVHSALNKHHSFTGLILYMSRKLNILCIIFKIIALFVITLFVQLYVRVGRGIATKRYGCTCIHIVFKHTKKELINK